MSNKKPSWERSLLSDVHDDLSPPVTLRPRDEALADLADQRARCHADSRDAAAMRSMMTLGTVVAISAAAILFLSPPGAEIPLLAWASLAVAAFNAFGAIRIKTCTSPLIWSRAYAAILTHDEYDYFVPTGGTVRKHAKRLFFLSALMFLAALLFIAFPAAADGVLFWIAIPFGLTSLLSAEIALQFTRSAKKFDRLVERAWDENPDAAVVRSKALSVLQNHARAIYAKSQEKEGSDGAGRGTSVSQR
ncbi:MAG: hypothetical protein ACYDBH_10970 [Acidobacteriaceae bacterium]